MAIKLHPSIDKGVKAGNKKFKGGTLTCRCATDPVTVSIKGNVAHNHACGCTKCWPPAGAVFSVAAVVPKDNLSVTSNAGKLNVVDSNAAIQRHACSGCGVHMYGRIENTSHPFYGLDFVHVELSKEKGWRVLGYAVFNPPATVAAPELLSYFVPRVSLVVLIEVFAYFFLRLYKQSLNEIKY